MTPQQLEERAGAALAQLMEGDRECQEWIASWNTTQERLGALGPDLQRGGQGEIAGLERKLIAAEDHLQRPEVQDDPYAKTAAENSLRDLRADLRTLRLERQELNGNSKELKENYEGRFQQHRQSVQGKVDRYLDQQGEEGRISQRATEFQRVWDPTLARIAQDKGIKSPESLADFTERAKYAALIHLERTGGGIPDAEVESFIAQQADKFLKVMDAHHREKSAEYARVAAERAGQPAPLPGGGNPPPAAEPGRAPASLKDVYRDTRARLDLHRRGVA